MTDKQHAGETPRTSVQPSGSRPGGRGLPGGPDASGETAAGGAAPRIKVDSVTGFLAVIPHLLGFHPSRSMVVVGLDAQRGRVRLAFRYDLPDPPDAARSREIAQHAVGVLRKRQISLAVASGYGAGTLVTPVADALRAAVRGTGITLRDLLRVEDGRYWSYLCQQPGCCPAEGAAFDGPAHPVAAALTAAGMPARPDRASLAAILAPLTGPAATSMSQATERALRRAEELIATASRGSSPLRPVIDAGRAAVREALGIYRAGGRITGDDQVAWLAVTLADLRVRDDAWARMDPGHRAAHQRLWTDVVRRATGPYAPAPACLLAFTAWQSGDGALANIAIERALAADPGYSMAHLLGQAVDAGLPPSAARPPMTPEEVEASYAGIEGARAAGLVPSAGRPARPAGRKSATRSARRRPSG